MPPGRLATVLAFALAAACGDDGGSTTTDAGPRPDSRTTDAAPSSCDYTEQDDAGNDDVSGGAPEATGVTLGADTVVCGVFESTHYDGELIADNDAYTFTVAADVDLLVRIQGAGLGEVELVGVDVFDGDTTLATMNFYGNHGVAAIHLPAGTHGVRAFALASGPLAAAHAYTLSITVDSPDTRCTEVTAGGYTEVETGASGTNDVYSLPSGSPPSLSAASADAPEASLIVLAPDSPIRIGGTAANVTTTDKFEDKDTYIISTGAGTNEATILVTSPTAGANLDWYLFEENDTQFVTIANSDAAVETKLTALKPNTDYWFLVGARAGATVPAAYNVTLCPTLSP